MPVTISCTPVQGKDLKPGDLFSSMGSIYWKGAMDRGSVGERVYIRTNVPADNFVDSEDVVYRIEITTEENDAKDGHSKR